MLSAVYYPHTAIRDESFLKHALLYWDEVEYISPWDGFNPLPRYLGETRKVLAQFLKPRVPTTDEKSRAHDEIMKLIEGSLPSWLQVDRDSDAGDREMYSMFRDKLLPETWKELKARGVVAFRKHGDLDDYVSHTYLGLTLMAILAKCCAGTQKHTITDRLDAYGTFLKHLEFLGGVNTPDGARLDHESSKLFRNWLDVLDVHRPQTEDLQREQLVSITLDVIDSRSLSVDALVHLRTNRTALGAELRQSYAAAIEEYVDKLSVPGISQTDVGTLTSSFKQKMRQDLQRLREELGPVARRTILSREVAVAIAAPIAGSAILTSTGVGSVLGGILAIGALGKLYTDYRVARDAVLAKHPMSFLYSAKRLKMY